MKKYKLQRLVPYVLISGLALSSCAQQSECALPARHIHLYTKPIDQGVIIEKYVDSEDLTRGDYNWQKDTIEITKTDEELFRLLGNNDLFSAYNNWQYLKYEMAHHHDFMEFYYHYTTTRIVTTTDSKGKTHTKLVTDTHSGWTDNPSYMHNTGRLRIGHHRYYAYRVNFTNNGFQLEKSKLVDDIREVMEEYPYVRENGNEVVYKEYEVRKEQLPYLKLQDIDPFTGPDLSNDSPSLNQSLNLGV